MSLPKYLKPESTKKKANRKEKQVYKHLCSGALSFKGDFSTEDSVIEHKSTVKKSISVTEKILDKLSKDTFAMGKENSILLLDLPRYYVICNVVKK